MNYSLNVSSPSQNDQYHFDLIDKALGIYNNYDKVLLFLTVIWLNDGPTHPTFTTAL